MTRGETRTGWKGRQSSHYGRIAEWIVAHPWRVILVWVLLLSLSIPMARIVNPATSKSSNVRQSIASPATVSVSIYRTLGSLG